MIQINRRPFHILTAVINVATSEDLKAYKSLQEYNYHVCS